MAKININLDLIDPNYRDATLALLLKLKEHSEESFLHSLDVAEKACILAGAFGIESSELKKLYTASLLHDIGKLYIDVDLLHKKNATE